MEIHFGKNKANICIESTYEKDSIMLKTIKNSVPFGTVVDEDNLSEKPIVEMFFYNTKSIDAMIKALNYIKSNMENKQFYSAC